jgi:hypothetical protein
VDPATASGTDAEKLTIFRMVRDQMRADVLQYLTSC